MKKYVNYFFVVIWLALSCQNKHPDIRKISEGFGESIKVEKHILTMPDSVALSSMKCQIFQHEGTSYFMVTNTISNALEVFNFDEGSFSHSIRIPREGPNSIYEIQGFTFHNKDSIFLFPKLNISNIMIVDWRGELVDFVKIPKYKERIHNHNSSNIIPTVFIDNSLHFTEYELFDRTQNPDLFKTFQLSYALDLIHLECESKDFFYPEILHDNYYGIFNESFSRAIDSLGNEYFSFPAIDTLYQYDPQHGMKKWVPELPFDFNGPKPLANQGFNVPREIRHGVENYSFLQLFYDQDHQIFARILIFPSTYNPDKHKNFKYKDEKESLLLFYDQNFKLLDMKLLPKSKYFLMSSFMQDGKLYIPVQLPIEKENESIYEVHSFYLDSTIRSM